MLHELGSRRPDQPADLTSLPAWRPLARLLACLGVVIVGLLLGALYGNAVRNYGGTSGLAWLAELTVWAATSFATISTWRQFGRLTGWRLLSCSVVLSVGLFLGGLLGGAVHNETGIPESAVAVPAWAAIFIATLMTWRRIK